MVRLEAVVQIVDQTSVVARGLGLAGKNVNVLKTFHLSPPGFAASIFVLHFVANEDWWSRGV
jgi:hypothetical protein